MSKLFNTIKYVWVKPVIRTYFQFLNISLNVSFRGFADMMQEGQMLFSANYKHSEIKT